MVQMGIKTPQKGSASSGRGLMRATSRMAGPTSEFLALFLEATGKKETPISANSQKDMRDMNCLLPNKASCLFRKYFKRDGQAYPLTASFSHHCRGGSYIVLHKLLPFIEDSQQTMQACICSLPPREQPGVTLVMWTGLTVSRSTPQLIHGAKGADVHTVGHTDACALVWLCEKPAR